MTSLNKIKNNSLALFLKRSAITFSKKINIPGFKEVSVYDMLKNFRHQIKDHNIIERASAISFNFATALPPTIIFLFTLIPFLPINKQFIKELYSVIKDIVPGPKNYNAVIGFLNDFLNHPRNGLLSLGFLLSLFFSSNAIMGVMRSFDKNYPGFIKRKGIAKRIMAIKITLVLIFLFTICIALMIAQGAVLKWIGIENVIWRTLIIKTRWVFIALLFFVITSYIYRTAPSVNKRWSFISPGSFVATFLMLLFALGFSWWVGHFGNYNKLYGSLGTLLILLIFIYFNSLVLLIGFELNVSVYRIAKKSEDNKAVLS
jgi:membrane protein